METKLVLLLGLVLLILAGVSCSLAETQVDASTKTGVVDPQPKDTKSSGERKDESKLVSNPSEVNKDNKKVLDQSKDSGVDTNVKKDDSSSVDAVKEKSKELPEKKGGHDAQENTGGKVEAKKIPKDKSDEEGSVKNLNQQGSDGSHAEECDPSNNCMDKEKKLIACLRVPGNGFVKIHMKGKCWNPNENGFPVLKIDVCSFLDYCIKGFDLLVSHFPDSPHFSLLIQNKGKGPLNVIISAPDFVELENKSIELQENHNTKVTVFITKGGSEHFIVLTAGNSECKLDIKDLIARTFGKELSTSYKLSSINFTSRPSIAILSFAALLILASCWMCISSRRKQSAKYQRLDMELPVSAVPKTETEVHDGWDNSWGDDDWDVEEAPHTPTMPVTPSPSSKGLASRRLNKDAWKD